MAGSYHSQSDHEKLIRLQVTNSKIKDYREIIGKNSNDNLKSSSYLSPLIVSYSSNTDVNSIFMLNVKSLLKKRTKYGNFLESASSTVIDQILNNFFVTVELPLLLIVLQKL